MSIETPPPLSENRARRLDNIQALRGIAAVLVVFYHIALFLREGAWPGVSGYPTGIWDQGWVGVDLFFVISGFIMVWTTRDIQRGVGTAANFLWRRALRIYPLWWICAAVMAVYFFITYGMPAAPDRVADASEGWGFALKSFALFPQTAPPLLGVGWTLIHEMWFYLVFALVICLPRRVLRPALVLWAAITVAGYLVFQPSQASAPVLAVMLNPLTLEFIAGAFAAWVLQNMGMPSHKVCVVIIGFSILWVVTAMALDIKVPDWAQHASRTAVYCLPLTLIVWASSVWQPRVPVWLRALGDMSYSLYLTHYLVLITLARIMRMIAPESTAVVPIQTGLTLLALGLSLAVGWLTFRLIERPLGRRLGRKPQSVVKA